PNLWKIYSLANSHYLQSLGRNSVCLNPTQRNLGRDVQRHRTSFRYLYLRNHLLFRHSKRGGTFERKHYADSVKTKFYLCQVAKPDSTRIVAPNPTNSQFTVSFVNSEMSKEYALSFTDI